MPRKTSTNRVHNSIASDLSAVNLGEPRSWAQIGLLLEEVERTEFWRLEAKSFTEWVRLQAGRIELKEASLWRYLAAIRYYPRLRESLLSRNTPCPSLLVLANKVGAESLELLSRLERVVPVEVAQKLTVQVLEGTISRTELRNTWRAYRPVLEGRTARGVGVEPPRLTPADLDQQSHNLFKATVLTAMASGDRSWVGGEAKELHEMFMHIELAPGKASFPNYTFDAVVLVNERGAKAMDTHGIEIAGDCSPSWYAKLADMASYFDFFWVVLPEKESVAVLVSDIPWFIGILRSTDDDLRVERPAQRSEQAVDRMLQLTQRLLLKALRR